MALTVASLRALEILDSRGRPTLQVTLTTAEGGRFWAGGPSGASGGDGEPVGLRDRDPYRYDGLGVPTAAAHVEGEITQALVGRPLSSQAALDRDDSLSSGLGDGSGFAPDLSEPEDAHTALVAAISDAGCPTGIEGVTIALDLAANSDAPARGERVEKCDRLPEIAAAAVSPAFGAPSPVWQVPR